MNPLPRILGMALFLVLAVLAALLTVPLWPRATPHPASHSMPAIAPPTPRQLAAVDARPARITASAQRAAVVLAIAGLLLAGALLFTAPRGPASTGSDSTTLASARNEIGTIAKLAATSAAQDAELSRERDVRRRAEEDAQLKQQLLAQSVDEKIRLGRDLHDGIIQSLYAVGLTVETVRPLLKSDPAQADRRLEEVRNHLNAAIRDVRTYITGLAPENLRRASFSRGVTALFEQLRAGRDAAFEIDVDDEAAGRLSLEQNIEALQIAREAISNALRHGEATRITLRMRGDGAETCLLVQDNGRGFDPETRRPGGHGLGNMQARAGRLGASLRITSQPGQGTRVTATFPTPEAPA